MNHEDLLAAVELHRPQEANKWGLPARPGDEVRHRRCTQCQMSVPEAGCPTWRRANGDRP